MLKSITRTILISTMGFAWDMIKAGERLRAFVYTWEIHDGNRERSGLGELWALRSALAIVVGGERLELLVNALAMKLGYRDGEVSMMMLPTALAY